MSRIAAALLLLTLAGCAVPAPSPDTPRTVARVDLVRYAGLWHEVARYPNFFQDREGAEACLATTAHYAPLPDGRVAVENRCRTGSGERSARATAYAVKGSEGARLRVSFFWPFHGDYWVIGLDPDYRWAVVGAPGRDYLWILSRTPEMAPPDFAAALAVIRREGFDPARLRPAAQPIS